MEHYKEAHKETLVSTCKLLGVDRQVYYRAIKSKAQRQAIVQKVIALVRGIRNVMPKLGARKLYHLLKKELSALKVGRDKLFKILRANHMLITPKKSYHITTDSHHRFRKHKNLISTMEIEKPESVWVSDITYVGTRSNPSYLALITDAYSKKIVGYNISDSLSMEGSLQALNMALGNRMYKNQPLIHHSDRGLQYCSNEYQQLLMSNNISSSMTEKYDPYENAIAERVNGILKQEFDIARSIKDLDIKKKLIKDAIDIYNDQRPHLSNHMLTPEKMHKQNELKRKQYKSKKLNNDAPLFSFNL
ncbi:IS3 family transposase [Flavivirga spongiicola]|uniref:IS3 family transposase n=1 Tax=Flavivirga spongiicola TaxID=421621 RepID=A0ABU7XYT4_9FLAO|nr:IS3 family transposase [Flavivirga sp. MEBiC05379]MDO5980713.1 IS3 family transposase [Flavivirga sp. MEBiC05379]